MGVATERMADQDDVVPERAEGAIGLVRHPDLVQLASAIELNRPRQVQVLGLYDADESRRLLGGCRYRCDHVSLHPARLLPAQSTVQSPHGSAREAVHLGIRRVRGRASVT